MEKSELEHLIDICRITLYDKAHIKVSGRKSTAEKYRPVIVEHKAEIISILEEQEAAKAEALRVHAAKVAAIEGLDELNQLADAWMNYEYAFSAFIYAGAQWKSPVEPVRRYEDVAARYPRAVAYRHAVNFSSAAHYAKAGAGRRAAERILDGEDYDVAIADMEAEWKNYCDAHIFD
ncbi:MAG: hypothetical protein RR235_07975 [Oscillospiraceae bacterium]